MILLLIHTQIRKNIGFLISLIIGFDIAENVGIKYDTTAKTFFRELYNKNILKKDKDKKLVYLSPFISMRRSRLYIGCYKMFREELRPYLTNKQFCDLERHLEECLSLGQV